MSTAMRPGSGLKYREGWVLSGHTPPVTPHVGEHPPTFEDPKASSTRRVGEGGAWARVRDERTHPL